MRWGVTFGLLSMAVAAWLFGWPAPRQQPAASEITFRKIVIDPDFRSEGVTVADVNRDGKPDILAGNLWYEAPAWTPHEIAPAKKFDALHYSNSFLNFTADVNGDGWPDQIVFGFPGAEASWRENPRGKAGYWTEHPIAATATSESPAFADLLGTGRPVLVFPFDARNMAWYEPAQDLTREFVRHLISDPHAETTPNIPGHGLGVGDVNGDGRAEVLTTVGYWEAPAGQQSGPWRFVPADLGLPCAQIYAYDVNADGLPDVLCSSPHRIGVWWFEQRKGTAGPEFTRHVIDNSFSQSHALELADINGDGLMDLVSGKRFWAHGPKGDVRPDDPCVLHWFELSRQGHQVEWVRHEIDHDSGVGTQFVVTDLNGDHRPDIVVSNKKGVFLFEQQPAGAGQ